MSKQNFYLACLSRTKAVKLWRDKLANCGWFQNFPAEHIPTTHSLGRVTAAVTYARQSVPHYNGAAMDGIAVKAEDTFGAAEATPKRLKILTRRQQFEQGGCYIIDTGDLMPSGVNSVIMMEDTHVEDGWVEIAAAAAPWQHVRIIGEDIALGEMVLPEHHLIRPPDIAALLAAGLESIPVVAKPKIAVIPTGTELVENASQLKPGAILDVNSHMLCAAFQEWGAIPVREKITPDDEYKIKEAVNASLEKTDIDMVVINAGTSAGTEDYTVKILKELGEVLVHGVAIKPGKPVILAICRGKPVVGLPGYPVSAMLTAEIFIKDIIEKRGKIPPQKPRIIKAVLAKQTYSQIGVEEYIRVSLGKIKDKNMAVPLGRGAGVISSLVKARGIVTIEEGCAGLNAQSEVEISLLGSGEIQDTLLSIGSHDLALDILGVFLRRQSGISLSCANVGSMGGITAVKNNEAHLAGIHMLDDKTGEYNIPFIKKYLAGTAANFHLVRLAKREQGLIVPKGNPKKILSLTDLSRPELTYVNRQRGSGTRMLLDYLLPRCKLDAANIEGYEKEVSTHMAVAATVASGAADAGIGIKAAATALGLDFIKVADENYDIILNFTADDPLLELIVDILKSAEFRREVERLGGYDLSEAGEIYDFQS